jgi:hypothetical protein
VKSPTESTPLGRAVAVYGRELAIVRRLIEQAARDAVKLYEPWGRAPKGVALSAMARDRFLELAADDSDLALSDVEVYGEGQDWVRVWLPRVGWRLPLRARPAVVRIEEPEGTLDPDLFGEPPLGSPVLFWRFEVSEDSLSAFSLVRVLELADGWVMECKGLEEVDITADLLILPVAAAPAPGSSNDDDDLEDLVGRWDSEDPQSEAEITDRQYKDDDDESDAAVGDDSI